MKLAVNLKLLPSKRQADALRETLERANAACNRISDYAWEAKVWGQFALQKALYYSVKAEFDLPAQVVIRCLAKVADAYKLDRKAKRAFRPHGAIPYDDRILRFKPGDKVSIRLVALREVIPFVGGERQLRLLAFRKGEVDLFLRKGTFYLSVVIEVDEPETLDWIEALGVDLGIVNIATDSDGTTYSGAAVEQKRRIYAHRRRNLQRKQTRPARRKLRKIAGHQSRYQRDINHCVSKAIVQNAQRTGRGIALEELTGIRDRVSARKRQRARLANWSFFQLRAFIEYKARLAGVPVIPVDPRNTSRTCPVCRHCEKANRPTQAHFLCKLCGCSGPADLIAAREIAFRARAPVSEPMVAA